MPTNIPALDVSRGTILQIDGGLWTVLDYQGFKAGKGNSEARVRMKLRDVRTGNTRDIVYRTDDKVARADVENRSAQYTYNDGDLFHFMDLETYDEKIMHRDILGDTAKYLVDGIGVELLLHGEQPLSVQLPVTVDMKITRADPGFKGDTAGAATKKATTHTGLTIDVPMFVNEGDVIKIDTRSGLYVNRV
jgi:elongation factor P